jgi:flavin prenyltransferase
VQAAETGAIIMPPVPAFYHRPRTLSDVVDQTVGRALDQVGLDSDLVTRWNGPGATAMAPEARPSIG